MSLKSNHSRKWAGCGVGREMWLAKQPLGGSEPWFLGRAKHTDTTKDAPDSAPRCVLRAPCSVGDTELIVQRLGRKLAKTQGSCLLASGQREGWLECPREEPVFKGLHFNYFQNPPCYLGSHPKPNGVIVAKGKVSTSL